MRRALFLTLLFGSTFSSFTVFGKTHPQVGGFAFSAEWLYMLNAIDIPFYVQDGQNPDSPEVSENFTPNGSRRANDQNWNSGYRLEGVFQFCDADYLTLRWTQFPEFSDSDSDTSQSSLIAAATGAPDNALAGTFFPPFLESAGSLAMDIKQKFSYYSIELLYGREIYNCCPFYFTVDAGIQYAFLRFREKTALSGAVEGSTAVTDLSQVASEQLGTLVQASLFNESKREGAGPELGFEMEYDVSSCFSAVMRGWGALLITRKHTECTIMQMSGAEAASGPSAVGNIMNAALEDDEGYWLLTPAADLRAGLNFDWCYEFGCNCPYLINLNLEVGYEVLAYFKSIDRIHYTNAIDSGNSFNEYSDFILHGPYLQLGVTF